MDKWNSVFENFVAARHDWVNYTNSLGSDNRRGREAKRMPFSVRTLIVGQFIRIGRKQSPFIEKIFTTEKNSISTGYPEVNHIVGSFFACNLRCFIRVSNQQWNFERLLQSIVWKCQKNSLVGCCVYCR